jgi:hypothetical protein
MRYSNFTPKKKPKWYELRKCAARLLVRCAQKIEPTSPDVAAFHMQQMMDTMITGGAITRINPIDFHNQSSTQNREKSYEE